MKSGLVFNTRMFTERNVDDTQTTANDEAFTQCTETITANVMNYYKFTTVDYRI